MRGDKLVITAEHRAAAQQLAEHVRDRLSGRMVVTVAGESGAGKSEIGSELARCLREADISSRVLQQDDYFVFPPKTNHEMRRRNPEQVGLFEVKLDFLDSNLRSFKRGESPIYKPLVDYDSDTIGWEELDLEGVVVLVVEGTYTTALRFADFRAFIDRTYADTEKHRRARARDALEPFVDDVLHREHTIISAHKALADAIVGSDYRTVALLEKPERRE